MSSRCLLLILSTAAIYLCRLSANAQELESKQEPHATQLFIYGAPFKEPLIDLSQSATVVQEERLREKGENNFKYEIESIPDMMWSGGTSRPRFFIIRGIGELEQYEGAPNPSVATIIDDIDFSGLGLVTPMFDIEQVEVLRGPQGIRFGSSALAGAINVRSQDPTEFTTGTVEAMAGNDELGAGGFAVGGAIPGTAEKLQMRFSAYNTQSNGFRNNLYLGRDNTNNIDESLARLKLRYRESARLSFDLSVWGVQASNGFDAFAIDNSLKTHSDRPGQDATQVRAASFKVTAQVLNNLKLEAISSAAKTSNNYSFDGDWGNNQFWAPFDPYDYFSDSKRVRRMLSQELRLTSDDAMYQHGQDWRWLAGLYGQRLTEDTSTAEFSNNEQYDALSSDYSAGTGAAFGQVETPLGNGTSLASGLRVEQRNASYDNTTGAEFSPNYTMLGGSLSLQRDLSEAVRSYLSASRGFKGGGFNPGVSVPQESRQYAPEYLYNFELGIKGSFFNRRLESNLALFYDLRRDQQLKFAVQDNPEDPLSFTYITDSSAKGESSGVELENVLNITPWMNLFVSGSIMQSEYSEVPQESVSLKGRAFSYAPNYQYSVGTRTELGGGVFARLEVTGKDSFYFDDSNNQMSDPYNLFNATLGYHRDRWRLMLWSRNLFNQSYDVRGFYFGNEPPDYPNKLYVQQGDPRAFGLTLTYAF